ncbi:MAG: tetratricopeptide repeat-containing sensor histidine kinase [Schleiferiaceae bacterium]|nr:tetratricopeptide repeat-containing sensor histidine kinase [Schleiferiaceae bacterium]
MIQKLILPALVLFATLCLGQSPTSLLENDLANLQHTENFDDFIDFFANHEQEGAMALIQQKDQKLLKKFIQNGEPKSITDLRAKQSFVKYVQDIYPADSTINILRQCIPFAEKNTPESLLKIYFAIGTIQGKSNRDHESIENLEIAERLAKEYHDEEILLRIYNNISAPLINTGNKLRALDYLIAFINLTETMGLDDLKGVGLMNIAEYFRTEGEFKKSLSYAFEAITLFKKLEDLPNVGKMHNNIAITFSEIGKPDSAIWHLEEGLNIAIASNDIYLIPKLYVNLADYNILIGNYKKAEIYLESADSMSAKIGLDIAFFYINKVRAELYLQKNQPNEVIQHLKIAEKYAPGDFEVQTVAILMSEVYAKMSNFEEAYLELLRGTTIRDSILKTETKKNIQELIVKFEAEKQRTENEKLRTEYIALQGATRLKNISIVSLLAFLILATGFIAFANQKKKITQSLNSSLAKQITTVNQQNQTLTELDAINKKLLSILSHDMRSPLINIRGILDLVQSGALSKSEESLVFNQLHSDITHTENLLHNIVNWVKTTKEKGLVANIEKIQLHQMADGLIALYQSTANSKNISIVNDIPKETLLEADEQLTHLCLRNLLSNALKFSFENSAVHLVYKHQENCNWIGVRDSGKGLSAEKLNAIKSGQALLEKGTKAELGTGLGLQITQEAISAMGGRLEIESSLNKGSTFWLLFVIQKS